MKVRIGNYRTDRSKKPRIENVQVHPWDTYSADATLALVVYPVLVAYKQDILEKGAVPSEFLTPVDVSGKSEEEAQKIHDEMYGVGLTKWEEVLNKMIWSFEQAKDGYVGEEDFFAINEDVDSEDIENRYDIDNEGLNDYYQKIDEGLSLFGRYYRSLWW